MLSEPDNSTHATHKCRLSPEKPAFTVSICSNLSWLEQFFVLENYFDKMGGGFKQCFNDVLGFRLHFEKYPTEYPDYFRVVDLRTGKQIDDGYRAIHLYYQRDNRAYPIEIQLWCGEDYQFNIWSHRWAYKYVEPQIGIALYQLYKQGKIKTEIDFINKLDESRGSND